VEGERLQVRGLGRSCKITYPAGARHSDPSVIAAHATPPEAVDTDRNGLHRKVSGSIPERFSIVV
jgi:hypothetical protein